MHVQSDSYGRRSRGKLIGDVLGHRSTKSTIPYLKLATEDLRPIALEIPGQEVHS